MLPWVLAILDMSNLQGSQDITTLLGIKIYQSLCLTLSKQKHSVQNHQGNRLGNSDMRPFTILQFSFLQPSATISITWDQQIIGIQTGTMTLLFISLTLTIKIAIYQSHKPMKFKRGIGKGGEIIFLLKLEKKRKQKLYFRNSKSPC